MYSNDFRHAFTNTRSHTPPRLWHAAVDARDVCVTTLVMADRTDEITRVFQELHGGAVKQTLHDAAVELLITQRVSVKPEVRHPALNAQQ